MIDSADHGSSNGGSVVNDSTRILVVDDDELILTLLTEVLSSEEGYEITCSGSGKEAVNLFKKTSFDLVITDLVMPGLDGIEVLRSVKQVDPLLPVIVITGFPSVDNAAKLINLGAADFISKPFNVDLIKLTVAKVLGMRRRHAEAQAPEARDQVAAIDGTTGLYNSQLFARILDEEVRRSEWRGHMCSLLVVSVSDVEIRAQDGENQSEMGDDPLDTFVGHLRQVVRPGDSIGRVGRGVFAVLLPETSRQQAEGVGRQALEGSNSGYTVYVGVACFPAEATSSNEIMREAFAALRLARSRQGSGVSSPP